MKPVGPRLHREFVEAGGRRDDPAAAITRLPVALQQILGTETRRSAEIPVGIRVPVNTDPRRPLRKSEKAHSIHVSSTNAKW